MNPTTSSEIRQAFLDFFLEMKHEVVASSPLPQYNNPTLLFTNAGMNQFADVFLGKEKRHYVRAVTAQKCMRVQGKHNDLENVGPSTRHHTFFEMLGNFSFGDYFKSRAIRYAYDFITKVCQVPDDRLWYTVYQDDDEAYNLWVDEIGVEAKRVLRMGDKTNFWMMGDVGPCGPTSEIHYDWGPEACSCGLAECSVFLDNDCERWLEIWNLVFMQFNQAEDGTRTPLPRPGVDTGMGLERIASVVQQTPVNYDNDLFQAAMDRIQEMLKDTAEQRAEKYVGYRVIADHGRAATFLLADGVLPGNVGPGYVLRMIIRRAARFGRKIGFRQPFLDQIAEVYIDQMGSIYPELRARREHVLLTLTQEEERFSRTLDSALAHFVALVREIRQSGGNVISGESAFNLYATHGLPLEITRDVAQEWGMTVDQAGFNLAREAHAAASGAGAFGQYQSGGTIYDELLARLIETGRLESSGVDHDPYTGAEMYSEILALLCQGEMAEQVTLDDREIEVVTAGTPFYVESGGEVSDTGRIWDEAKESQMLVEDMRQPVPGLIIHVGHLTQGFLQVGQAIRLQVDNQRRADIRRNHTATHVLHRELRAQLGDHVLQAGSLVAPDRLRFDFTHGQAVDKSTLAEIETHVNQAILANYAVSIRFMGQKEAIAAGAMALFGEKYGDVVRTIQIGRSGKESAYSFELCGGLHVGETAEIGLFRFLSESAVGAGLRRVEAVTGRAAQELVASRLDMLDRLASALNTPVSEAAKRLELLLTEHRTLQKELEKLQRQLALGQFNSLLTQIRQVAGVNVLAAQVEVAGADGLREMADWFRDKVESGVAVLVTLSQGKPLIVVTVTSDLIEKGLKAGDIVGQVAKVVGGGGGGRPAMAQAGGRDPEKVPEALALVAQIVEAALK